MSTNAVTPEAPAVSRNTRSEREPSSHFLPTDKKYRLTGEMPDELEPAGSQRDQGEHIPEGIREEREQEKHSSVKQDDPAASDSDTAAASEAAETQEKKGPAQSKSAQTSQSRWRQREDELKTLRAENARLKAQPPSSDTKQTSQPAAEVKTEAKAEASNPRPKPTDVDDKGKAKYATYDAYLDARDEWNQGEAIRKFQAESAKSEKDRQLTAAKETIQRTLQERVTKARKDYADYDEVMTEAMSRKDEKGHDVVYIPENSAIDLFILDSERGHDVYYEIVKNLDQYAHIFVHDANGKFLMSPIRQLRELAKIENSLGAASVKEVPVKEKDKADSPAPAKPVTRAAPPVPTVSGKGTVAKDAVEQAVAEQDTDTYIREQNKRALDRLKGK